MRTGFSLITIITINILTAMGCGDDQGKPFTDVTDVTDVNDATDGDTGIVTDAKNTDVDSGADANGDTTTSVCGVRECGIFEGEDCDTCDTSLTCTVAGKCEIPGQPLGAFCGATATCNTNLPEGDGADQWPGCQDAAQDDCNPADIVDGPTGNKFRCVNFAEPGAESFNLCIPGTAFKTCESDADCPSDETCTITNSGQPPIARAFARSFVVPRPTVRLSASTAIPSRVFATLTIMVGEGISMILASTTASISAYPHLTR